MASTLPAEVDCAETSRQVLDLQQLLGRCMGNLELAQRCLVRFEQKLRADIEEVERSLDAEDLPALAQVAHRVKGSAATVAAVDLAEAAGALEAYGRAGEQFEATALLTDFQREAGRFLECVPRFSQADPTAG